MWGHVKERWFLVTHKKQISDLHRVVWVYVLVFLVWGLYRMMFRLPVWFEEVFLKALVFGVPVLWIVWREESIRGIHLRQGFGGQVTSIKGKEKGGRKLERVLESLGMRMERLVLSMYLGIFIGLWMGVMGKVARFLMTGGISFNPEVSVAEFGDLMMFGLFTAFWEELLFMGYMLPRVVKDVKNEWLGVTVVAISFVLLHLPAQWAQGVGIDQMVTRGFLLLSLSMANGILYLRFKNLAVPVFAHLVWGATIYLFG